MLNTKEFIIKTNNLLWIIKKNLYAYVSFKSIRTTVMIDHNNLLNVEKIFFTILIASYTVKSH